MNDEAKKQLQVLIDANGGKDRPNDIAKLAQIILELGSRPTEPAQQPTQPS